MVGEGTRDACHYEMQHYDILGLSTTATENEINKKYRRLTLFVHPDRINIKNGIITEEDYTR